jgi:1-acyl-sn-glycerol-3-phosphate acyltransferase
MDNTSEQKKPASTAVPEPKWPIAPWVYPLVVGCTGIYLRLLGLEIRGTANIPSTGGVLVASNHLTNLDGFVVAQGMQQHPSKRPLATMGKRELFASDVGNWFYRSGRVFPVDRSRADLGAIRTAIRLLQSGEAVLIFPQGTRGGQEAQAGVGMLALKAKVPVLPVAIERLGQGHRVSFGQLLAPSGNNSSLTEATMSAIERLMNPSNK